MRPFPLFLVALLTLGLSFTALADSIEELPRSDAPIEQYTHFFTKKQFSVTGAQTRLLTYYLFEPSKSAAPDAKYPLVVVLHGAPGVAYAAKYLISSQMQSAYPSFILVPQSPKGKLWAMPEALPPSQTPPGMKYDYHPELESLPDVEALVAELKKKNPIDEKRVYIVGCSDGGTGVFGAMVRYPDVFAGGVAISGTWSLLDVPKMTRVPLQIWHGANDPIMPVALVRDLATAIKQNGGQVSFTELPNVGHQCSTPDFYSIGVWQWLFAQRNGG